MFYDGSPELRRRCRADAIRRWIAFPYPSMERVHTRAFEISVLSKTPVRSATHAGMET
jgi:hypothetical protein